MREASLRQAYWLASRGAQQMDLALRFSAEAHARGLRVLALKGIAIAEELYGGVHHRPMADIDFLVVDVSSFASAASLARDLGLQETGGSDHALVFKEPASGVVLELHLSLTSCPGLFGADHERLWRRRAPVPGGAMVRLGNEDLVLHFSLHTAFQHAFVASEYHARDFVRALEVFQPSPDRLLERAKEWGALAALGGMAVFCRRGPEASPVLTPVLDRFASYCPERMRRYLEDERRGPRQMNVADLARVRWALAPSKWAYARRSLFPRALPGRTAPAPGAMRRLARLVRAGLPSLAVLRA